ncbi:MAG: trimethylamine methyltransferase family protein [Phycisphaerae bacterium]
MNSKNSVGFSMASIPTTQLDEIHEASLAILRETGINVHCPELRALLREAGARVQDDLRTFIPPSLVDRALASAPSRIDIYNRKGEPAMMLEGTRIYFGTGSDLEYTIDPSTGRRRESTLKDVEQSARLCEKLANIDFVMSYGLPRGLPAGRCEIEQFRAMLNNTSKPIIMTEYSGRKTFEEMHRLACDRSGGETDFRRQPNYIMYGQFVSPLQHDAGALERLVFCADHGIPLIYVPTIMMGASGPVTLAGALALANAECLAGLVMHQLRVPGAPFIYGGCVTPLDMRTTVFSYGAPEWRMADMVLSQLSQRYRLAIFGTAGTTDAKVIDAQAGAEWAYSLLACTLAGTNLIHDVGYMESGLTGSPEALLICDEIIGMVKRFISGFEINEDTLALDLIHRVGPAGHFMEEEHTLDHFRESTWHPCLFDRKRFDEWEQNGKDLRQRCRERAAELLKT